MLVLATLLLFVIQYTLKNVISNTEIDFHCSFDLLSSIESLPTCQMTFTIAIYSLVNKAGCLKTRIHIVLANQISTHDRYLVVKLLKIVNQF